VIGVVLLFATTAVYGAAPAEGVQAATAAAQTINIGIQVQNTQTSNSAGSGVTGQNSLFGDDEAGANAIVAYINAHGGIAGRKIVPVFGLFSLTSNWASQYQAACATFTQDNHVFAVAGLHAPSPGWQTLASCLAAHKTMFIVDPLDLTMQSDYNADAPYLYGPGSLSGNRLGPAYVDGLVKANYFGKGAKIGVFSLDEPSNVYTIKHSLVPALAAHGLKIADTFYAGATTSISSISQDAAQAQDAALKFKAEGINHVMFLDSTVAGPLLFLPAARSEQYYPRYAMTTMDGGAEGAKTVAWTGSNQQLQGAIVVGWNPQWDISTVPAPAYNASQALCDSIITQAGVSGGQQKAPYFRNVCNYLFFLKTLAGRAKTMTAAGLRTAANGLGANYPSGVTFTYSLGPGRYNGVSSVRLSKFTAGCECFQYTGQLTPIK
jgi:hypothetical protein